MSTELEKKVTELSASRDTLLQQLSTLADENKKLTADLEAEKRKTEVFRAGYERTEAKVAAQAASILRNGTRPPFASFKKLTDEELAKQIEANG